MTRLVFNNSGTNKDCDDGQIDFKHFFWIMVKLFQALLSDYGEIISGTFSLGIKIDLIFREMFGYFLKISSLKNF